MRLPSFHRIPWLLLAILVFHGVVLAQTSSIVPHPDSRLWIEGKSNVNRFTCQANEYRSEALIKKNTSETRRLVVSDEKVVSVWVYVLVEGFDCGKKKMNSDLKKALQAEDYPHITFLFIRAETIKTPEENDGNFLIEATGELTVAGTTRTIQFNTEAQHMENGMMKAYGSTSIKMTDYDVKPPSALFGLVKAEDELTIHFDLIAVLKP